MPSNGDKLVRLMPNRYVHVHDNNTNITRMLRGPVSYTLLDHERVVKADEACIIVPPRHYVTVEDPVLRADDGSLVVDASGQVKVRKGDREVRFPQPPFPLYPGERVEAGAVQPLKVLSPLQAVLLEAQRPYSDASDAAKASNDGKPVKREAGEQWLVHGPCTLTPCIEAAVVRTIDAHTVTAESALQLRALLDFTDRHGRARRTGEEWLHTAVGAFIPALEEEVVAAVPVTVLTENKAVHLRARVAHKDPVAGKDRVAGEEWLVTKADVAALLPTPEVEITQEVQLRKCKATEYSIVRNPVDPATLEPRYGRRELRRGPCAYFLHPGEVFETAQPIPLLRADEAAILYALEDCTDTDGVARKAGDKWMVRGPRSLVPPVEVSVRERRTAIALDKNEGVYIRDTRSGHVRAHIGSTIMLSEHEELAEKTLPPLIEELLTLPRLTKIRANKPVSDAAKPRDRTRVVSCSVPHNSLVRIYDYRTKEARIIKGPEQVLLQPDEDFTVLSLSAGKPKQEGLLKTLALHTGPDFMTDVLYVETKDHARLQLQLAYNWEFDAEAEGFRQRAFAVSDFVGMACKAIASRVRAAVAAVSFDEFHKRSTGIIRAAVFSQAVKQQALQRGEDLEEEEGAPEAVDGVLGFSNGLRITSVDIHSVDPVDPKTREALTKSVQLAIEITTKSQEAVARHQATSLEQKARGRLERQGIEDSSLAETIRKELLTLEAANAAIETTGVSMAQAKATGEGLRIAGETEVSLAERHADADAVMLEAEMAVLDAQQEAEIEHLAAVDELEIEKQRGLAEIEALKIEQTMQAVGKDTIKALSKAGPQLQARLLKALGLQGYLVTDGSSPINLFNTAKGLTNQATGAAQAHVDPAL